MSHTVYSDVKEIIPEDNSKPLGNTVTNTSTEDANLNHCLAAGRSLTGHLHFGNQTPLKHILKGKQLWKQPHIVLNLCHPRLQPNRY